MKLKKVFIILAIFGLIFVSSRALADEKVDSANITPKVAPIISNVEITNISSNQTLVSWLSNYPDISYILYGTEDTTSGRNRVAMYKENVVKHYLPLKELKPDTTYYFRIVSDFATGTPIESQSYNFKTLSEGLVSLAVIKTGNGVGVVTSGNNISQDTVINCGDTCKAQFPINTVVTLTALAKDGSKFVGWGGDCELSSPTQCVIKLNNSKVVTAKFELTGTITPDPNAVNVPRVMFWWGKVNQHWNLAKGVWETDADGISGARENKLAYCKKFYPTTAKVVVYGKETIKTWRNAYNQGQFTSIKISYRCVLANENVSGDDVSNLAETPDAGSICFSYPNLDYCRPFGGDNPGINPPALKEAENTNVSEKKNEVAKAKIEVTAETTKKIFENNKEALEKAQSLTNEKINQLLKENDQLRSKLKERENEIIYLKNLQAGVKPISADAKTSLNNFITYGVDTTTKELTTQERAAAVTAYKTAFNRLPDNKVALADTIKIASGETPITVSPQAEAKAKTEFKKIYKRAVDLTKSQEASVVKVMAYGIAPASESRNLAAEKAGVNKFVKTYKRLPKSNWDWNIVKAVSYANDVK